MERAHYRRVARAGEAEPAPAREKLIVQCIVSGIILAAVLFTRLVESEFTGGVRNSLERALSGNISVDAAAEGLQRLPAWLINGEPGVDINEETLTESYGVSKPPVPEPSASPGP